MMALSNNSLNSSVNGTDAPLDTEGPEWGAGIENGDSQVEWHIVVFIVVALLIVVANMFVVLLITRKSALRTASNLIFVSLAVSDLLMGALGVPLVYASSLLSFRFSEVYESSSFLIQFISFSTMAHILLHTCDRYVYILHALRYEQLVTPRRVYILLAVTWITTLFASFIRLVWVIREDLAHDEDVEAAEEMFLKDEHLYKICSFALFFCLPLAVITSMDIHMLCIVHKQIKMISQQNLPSEIRKQSTKLLVGRKRKAVLTCIIILIVYVFCWLPYFVLRWVQGDFPPWLVWVIYYIRFMSSVCNPWLYTLRKPDLRKAAQRWKRKMFPCLRNRHQRREQSRTRNSTEFSNANSELIDKTSRV